MNYRTLAICIGLIAASFSAGWFARQTTIDRFVITRGNNGGAPIIKMDRLTGETWRYYVEKNGAQGFMPTSDWNFESRAMSATEFLDSKTSSAKPQQWDPFTSGLATPVSSEKTQTTLPNGWSYVAETNQ